MARRRRWNVHSPVAFVMPLVLLMLVGAAVSIGGCCSCRDMPRVASTPDARTAPPPSEAGAGDEVEFQYFWLGEQPQCEYTEMGRVEVWPPDRIAATTDAETRRTLELALGRAALDIVAESEEVRDDLGEDPASPRKLNEGLVQPDGVLGIRRAEAGLYVGTAFAYSDPGCRH
ncbi:MAG: hypothetical protein R6X25_14755 [Candidatus Krumholzibacteriia bacterium]